MNTSQAGHVLREIAMSAYHDILYLIFDAPVFRVKQLACVKARMFSTLLGAKISRSCFIHRGVRFINPKNVEIADCVSVMYDVVIEAREGVSIGENSLIGPEVFITTGSHRLADLSPEAKKVSIGANCFIGSRAIILPGVSVGDNSIVGAGSVVARDVPPNVLVAGVPAKVLNRLSPSSSVWTLSGMKTRGVQGS